MNERFLRFMETISSVLGGIFVIALMVALIVGLVYAGYCLLGTTVLACVLCAHLIIAAWIIYEITHAPYLDD